MKNLTLVEFSNATSSKEPVPGGGSIAALCGSLSAALTEMVANLTIGKKKFVEVEEEMKVIRDQASSLKVGLLDDIQKDSEAFTLVMNAFSLPKDTEEAKIERTKAIQDGLIEASKTPFLIAQKAYDTMGLAAIVVEKGNKNAMTDGLVSIMVARSAVLSALLNVKINLGSIKDESFVREMSEKVGELKNKTMKFEDEILEKFSII